MQPIPTLTHSGYVLVAVGTFFEGEAVMLAAGLAASIGLLNLPLVMLSSMAGIFGSDTACFLAGRFAGDRIARWFPKWHGRLGGAFRMIERHQTRFLIFFQFFPGLCAVTPFAFGMTRIRAGRFMLLDLVGNALWTTTFALAGYAFGSAVMPVVASLQLWLVGCAVAAGIATMVLLTRRLFGQALVERA